MQILRKEELAKVEYLHMKAIHMTSGVSASYKGYNRIIENSTRAMRTFSTDDLERYRGIQCV